MIRQFAETIQAANADVAIGTSKIFDAHTGAILGTLGFDDAVVTVSPDGGSFLAYDQASNQIVRYA